ncbi:MAG: hypothetical protein H0V17_15845 [Deltaproteobacteria bacterium]|nr:hypothetical protein [Deltaproteobacteria bacterium]
MRIAPGLLCLTLASAARANPASDVPSAADPGNAADAHVTLDYGYEVLKSTIERESVSSSAPTGPIDRINDLTFQQFRHVLTPKLAIGIYHDTWVSVALPITIQQARELELGNNVTRDGSSTVTDGLLPIDGFDATDPGTPTPGDLLFRGQDRKGVDQVHLGVGVAPMSQKRDPTKPTWKLGADVRLAVGKIMKFDSMDPGSESGVGRGVHELRLWTSFARRFARTEGWFEMFYQVPLRERAGSLYGNPGFGATNTGAGQQGGVSFGVEAYVLDDKVNRNRISLDVGASVVGHFEGRDYTEMWEVFALAGDSRGSGSLILDADPTVADVQPLSHPGITNFENYLQTSAKFALRAALGDHAKFAVTVDINWLTDHAITFADAGVDFPLCGGSSGDRCENEDNDLVNPSTAEVNPLHVPRVDLVGHRYLSSNNLGVVIGVQGQVLW